MRARSFASDLLNACRNRKKKTVRGNRRYIMEKMYCFKANPPMQDVSEAVIMLPQTEEQEKMIQEMARMWKLNNLGNSGIFYAEDFALQHGIKYEKKKIKRHRNDKIIDIIWR